MLKVKVSLKYSSNFKSCSNLVRNPKGNKTFSRKPKRHKKKFSKVKRTRSERSRFIRKFRRCGLNSRALVYNILSLHHASESIAKYRGLNNYTTVSQPKIFIQKSKKSIYTVLRAPYRYKKGRYQIGTQTYRTVISFFISIPNSYPTDSKSSLGCIQLGNLTSLSRVITTLFSSFSTNMSILDSVSLEYSLNDPKFFKISSYRIK